MTTGTALSLAALAVLGIILVTQSSAANEDASPDTVPSPKQNPYATVLLLGDSIGVGLSKHLQPLVPGTFEARVKTGRTTQGAVSALQGDEASFDVVLLSLGSNDALLDPAAFPSALQALLQAVRSGTNAVYWLEPPGFTYNTTKSPAGAAAFAQAMHDAGVTMLAASPVPPAPDDPMHLHLGPSGYDAFAHAIATALYA